MESSVRWDSICQDLSILPTCLAPQPNGFSCDFELILLKELWNQPLIFSLLTLLTDKLNTRVGN